MHTRSYVYVKPVYEQGACACRYTYDIGVPLQVSRAVDHVQQGTKNLENAKNLGKNTRQWMCCALVVLLIIAAIIGVVVFLNRQ